jgi:predicted dehydrogenase
MAETRNYTRRQAVQVAGGATVAMAAAKMAAPAIQTVKAANNQVRYGFIGAGSRGTYLLNFLSKIDAGRCVAMCDIYEPNLRKGMESLGYKMDGYKDYRELLARKDVDCVYIATPIFAHFPVTRDALLAGKHVFCEKSLVFRPEEVHALRALHNQYPRLVIQTGLQRRYSTFYQVAKQMVDKGVLGNVTHVRAQWHRNGSGRRPVKDPSLERQINWRFYRETSGGWTAELASHQIDVADWMFGMTPDFVCGIGGIDTWKDGRDTYDNIQLLYKYPRGQKLIYSAITTNSHLEFNECIMGTLGAIEITVGDNKNPARGLWFREPSAPRQQVVGKAKENWTAGATMVATGVQKGFPLLLPEDLQTSNDSFVSREMKFARRWLYNKGIMTPIERRDPVEVELESFLHCVRSGAKPRADIEVGLLDATGVILSNLAMDEGRRVYYNEIEKMGRGPVAKPKAGKRG